MKRLLKEKLEKRTTEQLKKDVFVAKNSNDDQATLIFVFALTELENRLSETEYQKFENTL